MSQRNQHYCSDSLLNKFKRLVRMDFPDLFFTPSVCLSEIQDARRCHDEVEKFTRLLRTEIWPAYMKLHTKVLRVKRLSRSVDKVVRDTRASFVKLRPKRPRGESMRATFSQYEPEVLQQEIAAELKQRP